MDRKGPQDGLIELAHELCESTDLSQVMARAYGQLARSLAADHGALAVSSPGRPTEYQWHIACYPPKFYETYHSQLLMEHDFIRRASQERPNVAISDEQMIPRAEWDGNRLIICAREMGMRFRRVMVVTLIPQADWHAGFVLYRDGERPFSAREKRQLQSAVPLLTGAVRSCHLLQQAEARGSAFESLLRMRGAEVLRIDKHGRELERTPGLEALLRLHFAPTEEWVDSLPGILANWLALLLRESPPRRSACFRRGSLKIAFTRVPPSHDCAVIFEDVLPSRWRGVLSKREAEVITGVLEGWDNTLIAAELGCAPETVKKHLQAIYLKLGAASRSKLIALLHERSADG